MTRHPAVWRKSEQPLLPLVATSAGEAYDIYPGFPIGSKQIDAGDDALAARLVSHRCVTIDGYGGVFWRELRERLDAALTRLGVRARWLNVEDAFRSETEIDRLVSPFLGGDDPLFGRRFSGTLGNFFDHEKLCALRPNRAASLSIVYGCGAALAGWDGLLVYVDVPKNEIQYRARAGTVTNLGQRRAGDPKGMYKRFYFVDWIALNRHKADLLPRLDLIVDGQRPEEPSFMSGDGLRAALGQMSRNYFRARPWFEPGPWGGQWMKQRIPGLPITVPNLAWSFELIAPENGLILESDGRRLEISFDFLMFHDHRSVLGDAAERFGTEFPIRFDFLDTVDGGNLSVQCHPRPDFIRQQFGENFTQDETYYILDCKPGARVYLGFREDIDPALFRSELEKSFREGQVVEIERFVQTAPAQRHDLFLIPNGTVHCSGAGNLVLEISATPYIFTFKMYDWLRLDLEGKPRPLNIARAFENLHFERRGRRAERELVSRPVVLATGDGWRKMHLPTHSEHFYDVHRLEFDRSIEESTDGACHVLNLVEGSCVMLETAGGMRQRFHCAETFVIPSAAERYRLINEGSQPAKAVKAFVKSP